MSKQDLIAAYYVVARDLEWRANSMHEMGKNCFEIADRLSELAIKEKADRLSELAIKEKAETQPAMCDACASWILNGELRHEPNCWRVRYSG